MLVHLIKSILHNIGVVIVGFGFAFVGKTSDWFLGITSFHSPFFIAAGWLILMIGFLLRVWATFYFYEQHMKVIVLKPQQTLITSGPYGLSRNPLYLGGNVFIFLGAVLILGSPGGLLLTGINIIGVDFMIRREEKQLEQSFGDEWTYYKNNVRRWL